MMYIYIYSTRLVDLYSKRTIRLIIDEFKKEKERREGIGLKNRFEINWIATNLHTLTCVIFLVFIN